MAAATTSSNAVALLVEERGKPAELLVAVLPEDADGLALLPEPLGEAEVEEVEPRVS